MVLPKPEWNKDSRPREAAQTEEPTEHNPAFMQPALPPTLPRESLEGLSEIERRILIDLHSEGGSYDEVHRRYGWSRGRIWALATRADALKTRTQMQIRRAERISLRREVFQEIMNTSVTADVLDFLAGIPSNSVQMIITSVPYNLGVSYETCPEADRVAFLTYKAWLMMIAAEMSRVLAPGGVVFFQSGSTKDDEGELVPIDTLVFHHLKEARLSFQTRIAWVVPHGLTPKNRPSDRYETALVFAKGAPATFNPTPGRTPQKQPGKRHRASRPRAGQLSGSPLGAWPSNVWYIPNVGHNHPDRRHGSHPCQFPLLLVKRAILLWTLPGAVVLDPFVGSGTSHVGAVETGRNFVGADLTFENLRARRVAAAVPDLVSPLPGLSDSAVALWQAEARRVEGTALPFSAQQERKLYLDLFPDQEPRT